MLKEGESLVYTAMIWNYLVLEQDQYTRRNTPHALYLTYATADCLDASGRFDYNRWHEYR